MDRGAAAVPAHRLPGRDRPVRGQPSGVRHALDRYVDAGAALLHAGHHAAAPHHGHELADPASPHARAVHVLLRHDPLPDLVAGRSRTRSGVDVEGHRQAAIHHRRLCGVRADDSAGGHVDQRDGAQARRQALAVAAPACLRDGRAGHPALLVAQGRQA
ncbi:lateral flagellar FliI-like assembly ATPase [Corchorus olitorius]|uniref:Lateral flagellar FliI-like assembly ATPase n=1 Tax=Corchorus olitorius TaxID=93759 RepID=A0A1R3L0S2_9ROSI|nr:lateral flagellar FliI-like assembly ATPase [Corchorus olitorius]